MIQMHGPSETPDPDTFRARFNPGNDQPFAVVEMGNITFITEPEDCDTVIRVWAEAKRLLLAAQAGGGAS